MINDLLPPCCDWRFDVCTGIDVDLRSFNDVHIGAVLLKTFLRELEEPIMTFALYDAIMDLEGN